MFLDVAKQTHEISYVSNLGPAPTAGGSVPAEIAGHAAASPGRLAVAEGAARLSYAGLERRSSRLAAYLRALGAGPGGCVGLFLDRSADFVVAALAVWKLGAAYLPLDPATPAARVATVLEDAGASLVVSHRGKAESPGGAAGPWRVVALDGPEAARIAEGPGRLDLEIVPAPESLAYVIYTSGSTGRPKGVEITHANLANLVHWHRSAFEVSADDRASQLASLGFDAAVWEIWPHLTAGASLHFADETTRRSPQLLRDWLVAEAITISFVPTVLAEQLLHVSWPAEAPLRRLLTGADTLHRRPLSGLPFVVVNNYGPTECTVVATSGTVSPGSDERPSIGRPISNTSALILDEALRPVPAGAPGELCLAGAGVGRGYRNNPELTASRFVMYSPPSGPPVRVYRTGDRVRLLENGEIAFLGRLDDQLKVRGNRIEPGEIVAWLDRVPGVEASAVGAHEGNQGDGPVLVAYVVAARDSPPPLAADLRAFLAARLPDYMVPAHYVRLAELPMTANGKLDRSALPAPEFEVEVAAPPDASPGLEPRIAALVASMLGQPSIGRDENFFMAGGHSMFGVQLVSRVRDTFGVKLSLRQLFNAPTVVALAAEVARLTAEM